MTDVLTYEVPRAMDAAVHAIDCAFRNEGTFTIWREPFRWKRFLRPGETPPNHPGPSALHSCVISNAYESMSAHAICADRGWELVHDFNHVAIVRGEPSR